MPDHNSWSRHHVERQIRIQPGTTPYRLLPPHYWMDILVGGDPPFRRRQICYRLLESHQDVPRRLRAAHYSCDCTHSYVPGRVRPPAYRVITDLGTADTRQCTVRHHDDAALLDRAHGLPVHRERQQLS